MTHEVCVICKEHLLIILSPGSSEEDDGGVAPSNEEAGDTVDNTVVDDCEMIQCGCHFHCVGRLTLLTRQCLLDAYITTSCPSCNTELTTLPPGPPSQPATSSNSSFLPSAQDSDPGTDPQILVTVRNEGGLQEKLDVYPILVEEIYLRHHPNERKARAFLQFCREGELAAVIDCVQNDEPLSVGDEDGEESDSMQLDDHNDIDILRYQDPLGEHFSALHCAIMSGSQEVAWLLLLLASDLELKDFPAVLFQEAGKIGLMRDDVSGKADIRSLKDAKGRSAEELAMESGHPVWREWVGKGRLRL